MAWCSRCRYGVERSDALVKAHLLVFWYLDDTGGGIRYLRLRLPD